MIRVENISKRYGNNLVLNNVSVDFKKGKSVGIVGKNGAGKTTLLNIVLGLTAPTSGSVEYDFNKKDLCRIIGVQMQDGYFESLLKVKEICRLYCNIYNIPYSQAEEAMESLDISHVKNYFLTKLSGGERQKVNILLSILHDPQILFFDEITTGLDAISRSNIYANMIQQKNNGKTIVLVSHYFEEIWSLCDSFIILDKGEVLFSGETRDFADNYDSFNSKIIDLLKEAAK